MAATVVEAAQRMPATCAFGSDLNAGVTDDERERLALLTSARVALHRHVWRYIGTYGVTSTRVVLFESRDLLRPGDRNDPWLLREQPGQRDLSRRRVFLVRDALE